MKLLRVLLLAVAALLLLAVIAVGVALIPGVQTAIVRRQLAKQPDAQITLGRVAAGFSKVELTDVRVVQPGLTLTAPSIILEAPLFAAASGQVDVRRLVAKGWTVELNALAAPSTSPASPPPSATGTNPSPPASPNSPQSAPPARTPFEGIFKSLDLPVDLSLAELDVEGDVVLHDASAAPGGAPTRTRVRLTGGGLGSGREGKFTLICDASVPAGKAAAVNALGLRADLALRMSGPRTVDRIAVTLDADARGAQLPNGAKLRAEISAERSGAGGETYVVALKSLDGAQPKELVALSAANAAGAATLAGSWKLDLRDADLAPFTLGATLPGFTVTGAGKVESGRSFESVRASGQLQAALEKLGVLKKELEVIGKLTVRTEFDLVQRGDSIRVNSLSADIVGAAPIASVRSLQGFEVIPAKSTFHVADPAADFLRIALQGFPLAWAQPFLSDIAVSGDAVRGEVVLKTHEGGASLRSSQPWTLGNLRVAQGAQVLVESLDLSLRTAADVTPAGWQVVVSELSARSKGKDLLTLNAKAGQVAADKGVAQPIKATGRFRGDLAALLGQPVLRGLATLQRGTADVDFTASATSERQQVAATVNVTELAATAGKPLPAVSTQLRADLHADGRVEWDAPVKLSFNGRDSDLAVVGSLTPKGADKIIDAQVTSNALYVEDARELLALAPASPSTVSSPPAPTTKTPAPKSKTPAPAPVPTNGGADTQPPWAGITGQLKLALKKVVYSADMQLESVTGNVKIAPDLLTLESLRAILQQGSEAKVEGKVAFEKEKPTEPYVYDLKLEARNFDPAPILRSTNPEKKTMVEGAFDVTGKINGRAPTLATAADHASADFKLTSARSGKFYGFATAVKGMNLGKVPDAISGVASLLGIAASAMGKDKEATEIDKFRAVGDVLKRFVEIPFDQLTVDLVHRPGAATEVREFSLISPDMRLIANGSVGNVGGLSLLRRPLKLDTDMAVRGAQAQDLKLLGGLKATADALGYTPLLEKFQIDGTLSDFGANALTKLFSRYLPAPR